MQEGKYNAYLQTGETTLSSQEDLPTHEQWV